jgi:predicted RNase H-like nuclease (RuvC/YqgF family)
MRYRKKIDAGVRAVMAILGINPGSTTSVKVAEILGKIIRKRCRSSSRYRVSCLNTTGKTLDVAFTKQLQAAVNRWIA